MMLVNRVSTHHNNKVNPGNIGKKEQALVYVASARYSAKQSALFFIRSLTVMGKPLAG